MTIRAANTAGRVTPVTFEQHFYATDEFPEIRRGVHSDYRTVAVSTGIPRSLLGEMNAAVALGSPGPELLAALEAAGATRVTAVGCWPVGQWVAVSRALAFAEEPNARPWTYFVHTLLVEAGAYASVFAANPFRVLRQPRLFADRPPTVETAEPFRIEPATAVVDAEAAADADDARSAGAVADLARLVGPAAAADLIRAAAAGATGPTGSAADGRRVLLSADLAPDGPEQLEGLFLALPAAHRRHLSFWSYRFAVKSHDRFRLLAIPPQAERAAGADDGILHVIGRPGRNGDGATTSPDAAAADGPADGLPPGGYAEFAASCVHGGWFDLLAEARRFIEKDMGYGDTPDDVEAALRAFRQHKQLQQSPTLPGYLALARELLANPDRERAVAFAFEQLRFGFQIRLDAAAAPAGTDGTDGDPNRNAARAALERAGPELPALLAASKEALDRAGLSPAVSKFMAEAAAAVIRVTPPGPWQARFLQAAGVGGLLAPDALQDYAVPWLNGLPGGAGNGGWLAGDWLEPLRDVIGTSHQRPSAAWALIDAAARRGATDPWIATLLQELWARAPQSREPDAFVAAAVRLRRPDVLYPALQLVFRTGGPVRAGDRWDRAAAALDAPPGPGHDFGRRLADAVAEALGDPQVQRGPELIQRVFNLLAWVERIHARLSGQEVLVLVNRLYLAGQTCGLRGKLPLAQRKQFYVTAYNLIRRHTAGQPFKEGAVAAFKLCHEAVASGVGATEHAWDLNELWSWLARHPTLVDSRHQFLDLSMRLRDRGAFCKVLASALAETVLRDDVRKAIEQYARDEPDQSLEDVFRVLADVPGGRLRGAARQHALDVLEWVRFVMPPPAAPVIEPLLPPLTTPSPPAGPAEAAPARGAGEAPAESPPQPPVSGAAAAAPVPVPKTAPAAATVPVAAPVSTMTPEPPEPTLDSIPAGSDALASTIAVPVAAPASAAGEDSTATADVADRVFAPAESDSLLGDPAAPPEPPGEGIAPAAPTQTQPERRRRKLLAATAALVALSIAGGWLVWARPWDQQGATPAPKPAPPRGPSTAPKAGAAAGTRPAAGSTDGPNAATTTPAGSRSATRPAGGGGRRPPPPMPGAGGGTGAKSDGVRDR